MNILKNIIRFTTVVFIVLYSCQIHAQHKYEREFRILKSQFPADAITLINNNVQDVKRLKFYKEIDSTITTFEAKFKKDKLRYGIQFNADGALENIQFLIKPTDIPNETFIRIKSYLNNTFSKYRIRRMQQQYSSINDITEKVFENAFQNLILPTINYKIIVTGKKDKGFTDYELLFNADGDLRNIRTSLPQNYDRILYK